MASPYFPPEIWIRVFRAFVVELDDWKWQRMIDLHISFQYNIRWAIWSGFRPGARSLALVCRQWANLILSDDRLKIIQAHVGDTFGGVDNETFTNEMQSLLITHPGHALHISIGANLPSELTRSIKSYSERIHGLTLYSDVSPSRYFTQLDCMFPKLQYFHWEVERYFGMLGSDVTDLRESLLLMEFIRKHSHHLEVLVLHPRLSCPISLTDIACGITILQLDISKQKVLNPPSFNSIQTLLKSCCNLEEIDLHTGRLEHKEEELRLNFLSQTSPPIIARRLREFRLTADDILVLEILSSISMPRLEALHIYGCDSQARIHPDSLQSAAPIPFPNLAILEIQPLGLLLADFSSIAVFSHLSRLSLSDAFGFRQLREPHKAFQHCNGIALLKLDGGRGLYEWMLFNLACHTIPLQSLAVKSHLQLAINRKIDESPTMFELVPISFLSLIHFLSIEGSLHSYGIHYGIFRKLPGVEILTFDMEVQSLNRLNDIISHFFKDDSHPGLLLPALKTLRVLLRGPRVNKPNDTKITRRQCEMLLDLLHRRFDMGYGLQTLICNHPIAPMALASLKGYVREIIICDRDAPHN